MKIDILGTEYEILFQDEYENPKLKNANGICEPWTKKIVICNEEEDVMNVDNIEAFKRKVMRHEIVHAFLNESGLMSNSEWAMNEEVVDWIAIQFPKMLQVFEKLKIER